MDLPLQTTTTTAPHHHHHHDHTQSTTHHPPPTPRSSLITHTTPGRHTHQLRLSPVALTQQHPTSPPSPAGRKRAAGEGLGRASLPLPSPHTDTPAAPTALQPHPASRLWPCARGASPRLPRIITDTCGTRVCVRVCAVLARSHSRFAPVQNTLFCMPENLPQADLTRPCIAGLPGTRSCDASIPLLHGNAHLSPSF